MPYEITRKLTVGFSLVIILLWIVAGFALKTFLDVQQEFKTLTNDIVPEEIVMAEMNNLAIELAHRLNEFIIQGKNLDALNATMRRLEELGIQHLEHEKHVDLALKQQGEKLLTKIKNLNLSAKKIISIKMQGVSSNEISAKDRELFHPLMLNLRNQLTKHKLIHMEKLVAIKKTIFNLYHIGFRNILLSLTIISLLALIILFLIARSIIKPLRILQHSMKIIGKGDLNHRVPITSNDEIGQLAKAFDNMVNNLKDVITSRSILGKEIKERKEVERRLKERVKELNAFYYLSEIVREEKNTLEDIYQKIVEMLPGSWQYPEITCCKIKIKDREFQSRNFTESEWMQSRLIPVNEGQVGKIIIGYLENGRN